MPYRPFVGSGYTTSGLLIVSESAYSWRADGATELTHPGNNHPAATVEYAINEFDELPDGFLRRATQAVAGKHAPDAAERRAAWDQYAYTIYVQDTVGDGPRQPPTEEMFRAAQAPFLQLLNDLKPSRVVILGLETWKHMPQCDVHLAREVQAYQLASGALAWCLALGHPTGKDWIGWQGTRQAIWLFREINWPARA